MREHLKERERGEARSLDSTLYLKKYTGKKKHSMRGKNGRNKRKMTEERGFVKQTDKGLPVKFSVPI